MRERLRAERTLVEAAREYPEMAAREMLVFASTERDRLRRQLLKTFGFSVSREGTGFRCRFVSPEHQPKTPEEAATWIDAVVALAGFEMALDGMWLAAAYFPPPDRARMMCNAFSDVMRETPAVYAAFANCEEEYAPEARKYALALAAAFVRSHLKIYSGTKRHPGNKAALEAPNWTSELAAATILGFRELGPESPIKRSTRYRDTLPRTIDGRLQKAPGPPDLINLVDRFLSGRDSVRKTESPELEFASFAEREALLRLGREAGLPPKEYQYLKLLAANPKISYREAARKLKISEGAAKSLKHRIKKTLKSA